MTLFFAIGALFAVQNVQGHSVAHAIDSDRVVDLHFHGEGRRRADGLEEMTLTLANGEDVAIPLRRIEELAQHGSCASYHDDGDLDVMVTGCEGDDRSITVGGHGSWELEASTGVTRRVEDVEDGCTSMEPPEDDADYVAMKSVFLEYESHGMDVASMQSRTTFTKEFDMEVRYYYDESLLEKYNGDHSKAKNAVREMHEHAKVMMRHESIGRKVHLLFKVEPTFVDLSIHAGPSNALPSFMGWLRKKDLCDRDIAFHHIITNRRSDGVSGVAWLGTVCHDDCYNTGITEIFYGIASSAQTMAHEFGHNLGALHTFSRQNQGRNCHGIMSYGSRPDTWSECSRERWTADYDVFVKAAGQSRADQCFRPKSGPSPTPKPTLPPTSTGCACSGAKSRSGAGGPECTRGWCYTVKDACPDGRRSNSVANAEWSYDACKAGKTPTPKPSRPPTPKPVRPPTPKPVPAPTPKPVRPPTPKPVPAPTRKPVPAPTPSGSCRCSGRTNSRGQGGKDCKTKYSSGAWCYTARGVCSDGRKSTLISNADMSYLACKSGGAPVSSPTPPPTPKPVASPVPSPAGYKQMPGGGWCMESNGWDESPRYTMPYPTTLAKTKAACDADSKCIAYVWGERYRVGMIYSTNKCAADCSSTRWKSNPKLITKSGWDGKRTFWRDAKCNVKN